MQLFFKKNKLFFQQFFHFSENLGSQTTAGKL